MRLLKEFLRYLKKEKQENLHKRIPELVNQRQNLTFLLAGFDSESNYLIFKDHCAQISLPGWWRDIDHAITCLMPPYRRAVEYVYSNQIGGDFAEFGAFSGLSGLHFAYLLKSCNLQKTFWTYDSFVGLPNLTASPDKACYEAKELKVWYKGVMETRLDQPQFIGRLLNKYLEDKSIRVVKGFFSETLKKRNLTPKTISLLHLDCDLFSSTKEVLFHVLNNNLLVDGAVIILDDFNCSRANDSFGQRKALAEVKKQFKNYKFKPWFSYNWHGQVYFFNKNL